MHRSRESAPRQGTEQRPDASEPTHAHGDCTESDRLGARFPHEDGCDRKRTDNNVTFDAKSHIPNEILAMILAFVRPRDVPAVARVARRWRALASQSEPDVILAYKDSWGMDVMPASRSTIKQRYLDRLRIEASSTFVKDDDNPGDDIHDVCVFLGHGQSITPWQLFKNLKKHNRKVEMFAAWVNERRDVIDDYWKTRLDSERDLAAELVDWARSELGNMTDDDDDDPHATSFEISDLESDDNLSEMSALVDEACKIVR